LATLDGSGNPTYRHPDHLSAHLITDASGTVIGTQGHLPFGESWYSSGTVDKWKFTTYERDTDTSLDYAEMRFDSGRLARFTSPDPFSGSINVGNPQTWNRYAFVTNDPTNLSDPSGLCPRGNVNCLLAHNNDDLSFMGYARNCSIEDIPVPQFIFISTVKNCQAPFICDPQLTVSEPRTNTPSRSWGAFVGCMVDKEMEWIDKHEKLILFMNITPFVYASSGRGVKAIGVEALAGTIEISAALNMNRECIQQVYEGSGEPTIPTNPDDN